MGYRPVLGLNSPATASWNLLPYRTRLMPPDASHTNTPYRNSIKIQDTTREGGEGDLTLRHQLQVPLYPHVKNEVNRRCSGLHHNHTEPVPGLMHGSEA